MRMREAGAEQAITPQPLMFVRGCAHPLEDQSYVVYITAMG